MKISYNWVSEYLPEHIAPTDLSTLLTQIGLEVEEVEHFSSIEGSLDKVVVGRIEKIEPIAGADKIRLTQVSIHSGASPLAIVCGAKNIQEGNLVLVALDGATLHPKGGEPFHIKKTKIRGIESNGMICSEKEIGVGDHHEGVMILEKEIPLGTTAAEIFGVYKDTVFSINLTPNRCDTMSHYGVARDICAYLSYHQDKLILPHPPQVDTLTVKTTPNQIGIDIVATEACQRYAILQVDNITTAPSPALIQNRLRAIGQSPINNIVDLTNYILHDIGQPLHAFDTNAIKGDNIIVKQGLHSPFVTLDGKERKMQPNDLMICNAEDAMCIAGVFGGLHAGIAAHTNRIVIESAYFSPSCIRQTSIHHQLRTEAATHFEKNVDLSQTVLALQRLSYIMSSQLKMGEKHDIVDIYPNKKEPQKIRFRLEEIERLAGKTYNPSKVSHLFRSLQFGVSISPDGEWELVVPLFKSDIECTADIAEEIIRIDGLNEIPIPKRATIVFTEKDKITISSLENQIATHLCGLGFYEAIHNSIVSRKLYSSIDPKKNELVTLRNNVSEEHDTMRPSMMEAGLETIAHNINHKRGNIKLFEFGKVYAQPKANLYTEKNKLSLWISGDWEGLHFQKPKGNPSSYLHAVGILQAIGSFYQLENTSILKPAPKENYSKRTELTIERTAWAFSGQVDSSLLQKFGIKQEVWYAEIDMDLLLEYVRKHPIKYQDVSKFHDVKRDIAFFIKNTISFQEVKDYILSLRIDYLISVQLFDLFQPKESDMQGTRSMGIRLTFQNVEKTLTDEQTNAGVEKIISGLEGTFQAITRKN